MTIKEDGVKLNKVLNHHMYGKLQREGTPFSSDITTKGFYPLQLIVPIYNFYHIKMNLCVQLGATAPFNEAWCCYRTACQT